MRLQIYGFWQKSPSNFRKLSVLEAETKPSRCGFLPMWGSGTVKYAKNQSDICNRPLTNGYKNREDFCQPSIFVDEAESDGDPDFEINSGCYWSGNQDPNIEKYIDDGAEDLSGSGNLKFYQNRITISYDFGINGMTVRPVKDK